MNPEDSSENGGGYDLDFLREPPDSLKCLICYSASCEPWQHGLCGRLFCKKCLSKYEKSSSQCPYCKDDNPQYFMDNKSE